MKKVLIFLILLAVPFNAYSFWIWSPKTQKWKNPKYSALATPYLQYKESLKFFDQEMYQDAYRGFKKILINYPDAKEAAEAQYYVARCLEKINKPYDAFLEYQKLIDSYPNSQKINETVEREYSIGEYFLNREHKKWLGVSFYDFVEHPSIEIFKGIVDKVPYSDYAPRAQYKLGSIFMKLRRYDEARDAFQKVIDNYSESEWSTPAKYQLAIATSKVFSGADYDSSYLEEAVNRLDEFIKEHPEAQISVEAEEQLTDLRNREAKKNFDIAQFYENQNQYKSAIIYYNKVASQYPNSNYFDSSSKKIKELQELVEGGITKKELRIKEKKELLETKKLKKIVLKKEKLIKKQAIREERKKSKQEALNAKKENKLLLKESKAKKINERKLKKQSIHQEKLDKKKELVEKKKKLKEQKRQEKLDKKKELIAKKKRLKEQKRQEKLQRVEERRLQKEIIRQKKLEIKARLKKEKDQACIVKVEKRQLAKKEADYREERRREEEISKKTQKKVLLQGKAERQQRILEIKKDLALKEKEYKIQRKQAKLKRANERKLKKQSIHQEKLDKKKELTEKKKKLKEQKRQEKLQSVEERRLQKEIIRQKKLEKKQKNKEYILKKKAIAYDATLKKESIGQKKDESLLESFGYLMED